MKKFLVKCLRYIVHGADCIITHIDPDKSKMRVGSYRVEIKFFLERQLPKMHGVILDVGSGTWDWVKQTLVRSKENTVISFDKSMSSHIDVQGDIYDLHTHFPEHHFDGVVCVETIEHVVQPFEAIAKIAYVLKPGGTLLCTCPFYKELHGEKYGDYWRITRQGWQELLRPYFEYISIEWYGDELMPRGYFITAHKKKLNTQI